jgi:predicted nucleic acid-binding protein
MAAITLDTGALIAAERGDARFWAFVKATLDLDFHIPAPVIAQAWRGAGSARTARLIKSAFVISLDDELARRVGELCGKSRTSDIVDATVAVVANRFGDDVLTGDAQDIVRLLEALGSRSRIRDLRGL